jgi:hypothetical protein
VLRLAGSDFGGFFFAFASPGWTGRHPQGRVGQYPVRLPFRAYLISENRLRPLTLQALTSL